MLVLGFRLPFTNNTYRAVSQFPELESDKGAGEGEGPCGALNSRCPTCGARAEPQTSSFTNWAIALCLLCTSLNFLIFLFPNPTGSSQQCKGSLTAITKDEMRHLRRPSPFIGLTDIDRPNPPIPRSLINYPQVVAQIDEVNKNKVFDDDPLRFMTHTGSVSPEGRQVRATKSISTIVQFRAIDFGMETCELKLHFPVHNTSDPFMISLHRLSANQPIDTKTLSYKTRPSRVTNIANIQVSSDSPVVDWSNRFSCSWDELLTFELACFDRVGYENDRCSLMWWQDQESDEPERAIYIMQHATV